MSNEKWKTSQALEREWWLRWKERTDMQQAKEVLLERAETVAKIIQEHGESGYKKILQIGPAANGEIHFIRGKRYAIDPLACFFKDNFKELIDPDVDFIEGVGEDMPYENTYFDAIIILNVLDHCSNSRAVMNEIGRCLKSRGLLILQVNLYNTLGAIMHTVFGFLDKEHPAAITPNFLSIHLKNRYEILEESCTQISLPGYDILKKAVLMVAEVLHLTPLDFRLVAKKL